MLPLTAGLTLLSSVAACGKPRAVHNCSSVGIAQRIENIVGRDEKDLAAGRGRRAADGLADPLRPQNRSRCLRRGSPPCRSPSRRRDGRRPWRAHRRSLPCDFSFSGVTLRRPDLGAAGSGEGRHPAARVERIDLAVGDQRHRAQAPARRRAGSGVGRPYLARLVAESEMAEIVGGRAARLRPRRVGLRRGKLHRSSRPRPDRARSCWGR